MRFRDLYKGLIFKIKWKLNPSRYGLITSEKNVVDLAKAHYKVSYFDDKFNLTSTIILQKSGMKSYYEEEKDKKLCEKIKQLWILKNL